MRQEHLNTLDLAIKLERANRAFGAGIVVPHPRAVCSEASRRNHARSRRATQNHARAMLPILLVRLPPLSRALLPGHSRLVVFLIPALHQVLFKAPLLVIVPVLSIAHLP